jgi:type IV pilus assembly protein PilQ
MRKLTKAAGILFLAASSVYFGGAGGARLASAASPVKPGTTVQPLPDAPLYFGPTTAPSTQPATTQPAQPAKPQPPAHTGQPVLPGQVSVKDAGTVEIHVNDANLVEVLRMLSLQSQKNIVATKDVRGTVTANLYDVTIKEALDAILRSNGYDYREKGNFIYVYTAKELADMEKALMVRKTEIFRLYYTPVANAANLIKPVLSDGAQVALTTPAQTGIDAEGKDAGGNSHATEDLLVVSDYPDRLEQVRAILKEVDRRPVQILVEATILQAQINENNALGINFTALGGVNFSSLSGVGTFSPAGAGLAEALSGTITSDPTASTVNRNAFGAVQTGGNGIQVGVVTNNVGMFINALEGVTDTVIVANPKVLCLNKQKGEVHIGDSLGYQTAITTDTLTANTVQFLETGTSLVFRPYVGDNGNIRMEVHPENSTGTVTQGLPNKYTTEITTNVMVKDGHTIVIGGLFFENTTRTRNQVPGLGSLPGVGTAFRNQSDTTNREELIILLTPHIIKEQLLEADRLRVGMRRGLMPWGRERLADGYYEKAVAEMNKPTPDQKKALWYLNCALDMHPLFSEAIALKSKITGHEATAADNSSIRNFVRDAIMADKASGATLPSDPPEVVPPLAPTVGQSMLVPFAPSPAAHQAPTTAPSTQPLMVKAGPATAPAESHAAGEASLPATNPSQGTKAVKNVAATDQNAVPGGD